MQCMYMSRLSIYLTRASDRRAKKRISAMRKLSKDRLLNSHELVAAHFNIAWVARDMLVLMGNE